MRQDAALVSIAMRSDFITTKTIRATLNSKYKCKICSYDFFTTALIKRLRNKILF